MARLLLAREEDVRMRFEISDPGCCPAFWRTDDEEVGFHAKLRLVYAGRVEYASTKIFGERNTGTNLLKQMIELNSTSRCLPSVESELDPEAFQRATRLYPLIGVFRHRNRDRNRLLDEIFEGRSARETWKHCATIFDDASAFEGVFVIFAVRHPASWLVSLYARQYNRLGPRPRSLRQLIEAPWPTVRRERLDARAMPPLELYNEKVRSYLQLAEQFGAAGVEHAFVRFEDLTRSQEEVYRELARALPASGGTFREIQKSTKDDRKTASDYRDYYARAAWKHSLVGLEATVNERVDWDQIRRFGYEPI